MRSVLHLRVALKWSLPSCSYAQSASARSANVISTTGYSFVNPAGNRIAKYGVYFGEKDDRNVLEETPERMTHVAAKIQAVIKATELAADSAEPCLIRTDFKLVGDYRHVLNQWAKRDFRVYGTGVEMKNAPLLRKLHAALASSNVSIEYCPSVENGQRNYVTDLILQSRKFRVKQISTENFSADVLGISEGSVLDAGGKKVATSCETWPKVYVGAKCVVANNGYASASFCSYWPAGEAGGGLAHRLSIVPVTLFRAQLAAIEDALNQAIDCGLSKVLVVTDSPHFMSYWSKRWLLADGSPAANKFFYDRIHDLATKRGVGVRFRYERGDSSPIWHIVRERCEEGLSFPVTPKSKEEYHLSLDEMTEQQCSSTLKGSGMTRVRVYKKGTQLPPGLLWDTVDSEENVEFVPMPEGSTADMLLEVLRKADADKQKSVVVRTDSSRLIRASESWLPIWKRSGFRNSRHKPIKDWQKWDQIVTLKKRIQIHWELMDPPTETDISLVQPFKLPPASKS